MSSSQYLPALHLLRRCALTGHPALGGSWLRTEFFRSFQTYLDRKNGKREAHSRFGDRIRGQTGAGSDQFGSESPQQEAFLAPTFKMRLQPGMFWFGEQPLREIRPLIDCVVLHTISILPFGVFPDVAPYYPFTIKGPVAAPLDIGSGHYIPRAPAIPPSD